MVEALGLIFPFEESGVQGYNRKLRTHVVQAEIPLEVAQLVYSDYHARNTKNPFVLITCASVWFAFSGMIRDAHPLSSEEYKSNYVHV